MSLELKIELKPTSTGEYLAFKDITGTTGTYAYTQDSNISYSQVTATRFKFGTYETLSNIETLTSGSFTQYKEYINAGSASKTVDSKVISVGETFVPQITGISVPANSTWETTGYYVYPLNYFPTSSQVALDITSTQLGETGDTIVDNIRLVEYEVYYPQSTPSITSTSGTTYIVSGAGTVGYGGSVYRVGEVFTAYNASSITAASGSPKVNALYATVSQYFATTWSVENRLYQVIFDMLERISISEQNKIVFVKSQLEAIQAICLTNNVSISQAYDLLLYITDQVTFLE